MKKKKLEGIPGVFDIERLPKDARDELIKRLEDNPNIRDTYRIISQFIKDIELKVDEEGSYKISHIKLKKAIEDRIKKEKEALIITPCQKLMASAFIVLEWEKLNKEQKLEKIKEWKTWQIKNTKKWAEEERIKNEDGDSKKVLMRKLSKSYELHRYEEFDRLADKYRYLSVKVENGEIRVFYDLTNLAKLNLNSRNSAYDRVTIKDLVREADCLWRYRDDLTSKEKFTIIYKALTGRLNYETK